MSKAVHRTLEAKLAALNGPEWDSSDEETPVVPLEKKQKKQTGKKQSDKEKKKVPQKKKSLESRVIYLGHLPPNFEEPEIKGFLSQFGHVTRLKLIRSRRTANSRGFAYCEFADPQVAAIVAETMSGYLMSQKRLVCHIVENARPDIFEGHDRVFQKIDWTARHREQVNKPKSSETMSRITKRLLAREKKKREALKEMDIDYDFPGYQASVSKMSDQDNADNKEEKPKRRKESIDAEEPPEKLTKKQRKDSVDIFSEKKTPKSVDAPLEKLPKKKLNASAENKQPKHKDSGASLGTAKKEQSMPKDSGVGSVQKQSKSKDSEVPLRNVVKKLGNCDSSKDTALADIVVTPKKKQTKVFAAKTEVKKTKASKKRRVSA